MHLVAALAVLQHFFGVGYQQGLGREYLQVGCAYLVCECSIGYFKVKQHQPHTLPAQLIALDEFIAVALPQAVVVVAVFNIHLLKVFYAAAFEVVFVIELAQCGF